MKKQIQLTLLNLLFFSCITIGQNVILEGYIFEDNNRGFLNEVEVDIFDAADESFVTKTTTDFNGLFVANLPANKDFILKISKDLFFPKEEIASTKGKTAGEKAYAKIKMERKPGYIFDVTLAESGAPTATVDAISGARIEVFNNTNMEEVLVIDSLAGINFDVTFERGNHYTVLIRKEGYFNKRLEAYVDVEGCILCFEGVGTVTPGVSDVMSEGFQMGSVLANIELEPARLNRTIEVENIYYDLDKYYIRDDAASELDKVVTLLKDNPSIILELGSHTDSRGGTRYNKQLSSKRAKAAVDYIIEKGGISSNRISSKGYGESVLVNDCVDGKKCSEEEHQKNRRTELKVVGFERDEVLESRSLSEMLIEEKLLREVLNSEQIEVKQGEVPDFDKLNGKKTDKIKNKSKTTPKSTSTGSTIVPTAKPNSVPSAKSTPTPSATTTATASTKVMESTKGAMVDKPVITSANTSIETNAGETLVKSKEDLATKSEKMTTSVSTPKQTNMLSFGADKVMIVKDGQVELVTKMIGNQLNTKITDLLIGNIVHLQKPTGLKSYKFDSIGEMPMDFMQVFTNKLAILKKKGSWQLYPMEKDATLPIAIQNALR